MLINESRCNGRILRRNITENEINALEYFVRYGLEFNFETSHESEKCSRGEEGFDLKLIRTTNSAIFVTMKCFLDNNNNKMFTSYAKTLLNIIFEQGNLSSRPQERHSLTRSFSKYVILLNAGLPDRQSRQRPMSPTLFFWGGARQQIKIILI